MIYPNLHAKEREREREREFIKFELLRVDIEMATVGRNV